ncbi:carbohydrate ABC transporter permease [Fimbriimonas ginsengisoli]|uniref:Transport system inner membrane component n=1 Tax=Fimbriimonas ginsengisoli Gsoil 348 TaxID=661478 RepID=A0A068NN92_FIMGI|nr:carbohydrate ABC transporter permease [Fimbriimonas ginsengisoli]AIE84926.1 transport system inner membrane component [Fimbriimonas ginsengisoli Gsoil 348]
MRRRRRLSDLLSHAVLLVLLGITLLPFVLLLINSFRTNFELDHAFFGIPDALGKRNWTALFQSYRDAWQVLRPYTLNTIFVAAVTALGVTVLGSSTAYVFSRYRFPGHRALFFVILSFMMIPGILTLVPSFLLVKRLGMLNSYWVLILPYIAGGQVFAIFLFKSFFDGLPGELFESARIDGAGHLRQYTNLVLPLSKQVFAVVLVTNVLGTWNNFLWPFITNSDAKYHTVSSGLFLMSSSTLATNYSNMFAAYLLSAIPMLILFLYATKPFMAGLTSGAFKA